MKKITLALFLLLKLSFSFSQVNLNLGLMAYYPFNGNANDASSNNNNPSFNNATLTTDRFGTPNTAYHFNGTNNYIQIPNSPTINMGSTMSIALWVKPTGFYTGACYNNMLMMKGITDIANAGNYSLRFADAVGGCGPSPNTAQEVFFGDGGALAPTPFVQLNKWYSVIWTYDGTTAKIYIDCVLKGSSVSPGMTFTNAYDLFLGHVNNAIYPYWLNGDLDEVRVYNRALNTDEVNTLGGCNLTSLCNPTFQKRYGGNKADIGSSVAVNADGSYVIGGYTTSFGSGGYDGYLQKIDKTGNIVWSKTFGDGGNDYLYVVKQTPDGGYVAAGRTTSYGGSANGVAWIVKTDANGALQWAKKYDDGTTNGTIFGDITTTSDGGFAMAGVSNIAGGTANAMVIKTDNNGIVQWAKLFDSFNTDESFAILEDADSLVVSAHQYGQSSSMYDLVIMKLNRANGNVVWARNYDIEGKSNRAYRIYKTVSGYGLAIPDDNSFVTTNPETVILNTNRNGLPLAISKFTHSPNRLIQSYSPTNDGGYVVTESEWNNPSSDIALIKVNNTGSIQWAKTYGGPGFQASPDIKQTADGGYILAAYTSSNSSIPDSNDIYIIKTDSLGNSPGCNNGTTTSTITTPAYNLNSSFVWASITNDNFINTAITPVTADVVPSTTQLCASCSIPADTIINDYSPVIAFDKCKNLVTVVDAAKYKTGDTVLLIQMKGAVIDSTNTASFGNITNYKNAGNYEFNYIKSKYGDIIELRNALTKQYDIPDGKVQLIRVPFYQKLSMPNPITCLPWNGSMGGVLAFNVADTLNLNTDIDVSNKGLRGGQAVQNPLYTCNIDSFYVKNNDGQNAAMKGEGIFATTTLLSGRGKSANGGGGGNAVNSGGAGGGNAGAGGHGGKQYVGACNVNFDNGGVEGAALTLNNTANKIFLGGGGGAGQQNDIQLAGGGNGGGIAIITAGYLKSNGFKIRSTGQTVTHLVTINDDGKSAGGAGGTILLNVNNFIDASAFDVSGGNGDYVTNNLAKHGPGGGGGGGAVWFKQNALPALSSAIATGGSNGTNTSFSSDPWGATAGQNGSTIFGLQSPVDIVPFTATFDSAKLHIEVKSCTNFKFWGLDNAITSQIVKWQWSVGDGYTDTVQTFTHNYLSPGTYPVKLTATDIYGCVMVFKVDLTVLCRCEAIKIITPNPARDIVTISGLGCGTNSLVLYDMLGQKIADITGDHPSETFDISNLAKGMYVIRVINNNKVVKNLKVEKL